MLYNPENRQAEWVEFDLKKVNELKEMYLDAMGYIQNGLSHINLNARKDILNFFEKSFKIKLKSTKIEEVSKHIHHFGKDSEEADLITGIVYYMKMKYTIKNYLDYIIKHEGRIVLSPMFGKLMFNSIQPLPKSPEILDCITASSIVWWEKGEKSESSTKIDVYSGEGFSYKEREE
jgi:hypothetical protein